MLPWVQLDSALLPGGGDLRLKQRGTEFSIMLGSNELMNSRLSGSEEALARLAAEQLRDKAGADVLIGGLGMGFTLRAALDAFGSAASIEVAELVPEVVAWARGAMASVFSGCLDDQRVTVTTADVRQLIATAPMRYDAILLDVDNGPDGLTIAANDALYDSAGLEAARRALRPGGVLAVWSQGPDPRFYNRLRQSGFAVTETKVRASRNGGGARHVIWLARR